MKNREKLNNAGEKPALQYLQDYIRYAPTRTEKEFTTTKNTWTACFLTNIVTIEMQVHLYNDELQKTLMGKYQIVMDKLKTLKKRSLELREQYLTKEVSPPDDVKRELWSEINNIFG